MLTYHVNPESFEPSVCKARAGNCRFALHVSEAEVASHFRTYEAVMADYTLVRFSKHGGKTYDHVQSI